MHVPLPSLPKPVVWLAGLIGVGMILGLAGLGTPHTFIERALCQFLEIGATAAFAVAGLSGLALSLQERELREHTQDLAVLALERVEGELAALVQQTYDVLAGGQDSHNQVLEVKPAFRVPIAKIQRDYWYAALKVINDQQAALASARAPADKQLAELLEDESERAEAKARKTLANLAREVSGKVNQEARKSSEQPPAARAEMQSDQYTSTAKASPASKLSQPSESIQRLATMGQAIAGSAAKLDFELVVNQADAQSVALRNQWSILAEAVAQLAELLDSDEARTLLERAFRLRDPLEVHERPRAPRKVSTDNPERRALELEIQTASRAQVVYSMVCDSLVEGWALLEALDDIFRDRVADCDAAKAHITSKQRFDVFVSLDASANATEQAIQKIQQTTAENKQRAERFTQLR